MPALILTEEGKTLSSHSESAEAKGLVQSSMRRRNNMHAVATGAVAFAAKPQEAAVVASVATAPISADRKARWAALLSTRPSTKDGDQMSNWLMEVLAVSDLESTLKHDEVEVVPQAAATVSVSTSAPASAQPKKDLDEEEEIEDEEDDEDDDDDYDDADESVMAEKDDEIVPKKRKLVNDTEEVSETNKVPLAVEDSPSANGGSFAEWKERKKQRKQAQTDTEPTAGTSEPV